MEQRMGAGVWTAVGDARGRAKAKRAGGDAGAGRVGQVEKPLDEAIKLLDKLQEHAGDRMETHTLSLEVYSRRGRFLKALQSIRRAAALVPAGRRDPALHTALVRFLRDLATSRGGLPATVGRVLELELAASTAWGLGDLSSPAAAYNEAFVRDFGAASLAHAVAGARAAVDLDPARREPAAAAVLAVGARGAARLAECEVAVKWMKEAGCTAAQASRPVPHQPRPEQRRKHSPARAARADHMWGLCDVGGGQVASFVKDAAAKYPRSDTFRRLLAAN
jgi:hypothetical protein